MILTLKLVCFVLAAVCFIVKGIGVSIGQIDLMNIGFALVTIGSIV